MGGNRGKFFFTYSKINVRMQKRILKANIRYNPGKMIAKYYGAVLVLRLPIIGLSTVTPCSVLALAVLYKNLTKFRYFFGKANPFNILCKNVIAFSTVLKYFKYHMRIRCF